MIRVEPADIDRINILEATKSAMRLAVSGLSIKPDVLLIDAVNLSGTGAKAAFTTAILLNYNNCTARIPKVSNGYTLTSADNTQYKITKGAITITYDALYFLTFL